MKPYSELVKELDEKIPREVISRREGGGGRKLDYLEGHYIIDRLNKVFGHGNWSYDSNKTSEKEGSYRDKYGKDIFWYSCTYRILLVVEYPGGKTQSLVDVGYGDGQDKTHPGKCLELAQKEAVTDGLKRCAKNLGMSFGLALYDKTQENVAEPVNNQTGMLSVVAAGAGGFKLAAPEVAETKENTIKKIRNISRVVVAKKIKTLDELKADVKNVYKVEDIDSLSMESATRLLKQLETMINQ